LCVWLILIATFANQSLKIDDNFIEELYFVADIIIFKSDVLLNWMGILKIELFNINKIKNQDLGLRAIKNKYLDNIKI